MLMNDGKYSLQDRKELERNHYDEASWLSRLFFLWPERLIALGALKTLTQADLPEVSVLDESQRLFDKLDKAWKDELAREIPSLSRAIFTIFIRQYGWIGAIITFESAVRIYQAYLLGLLIDYFLSPNSSSTSNMYGNGTFQTLTFSTNSK